MGIMILSPRPMACQVQIWRWFNESMRFPFSLTSRHHVGQFLELALTSLWSTYVDSHLYYSSALIGDICNTSTHFHETPTI
ncbi:hypothetical protein CY34DRAFT_810084 [Suillus luteus UH-Slu-Lm8-n1]|uniref:Uncharacterized protein n=1 Tax=Suillus luteus UH-Slu-Lm8-n1 TaxID=930992 RepID=A0A0D0ATT2_9AGAM|nr:hypothetical protein CY34DRAFT_810084 [Suillus luteus UH-Slu-Lm8-n1]